jgi:hypothetical protein
MTFLPMASSTIKLSLPNEHTYNLSGPMNLSNYAHPYLPPGMALSKDLGGRLWFFLEEDCTLDES